jgi:alpha-methylacyl-CoA racemase
MGTLERPAPTPRFSLSQPTLAAMPADRDCRPATVLARFGVSESEIEALVKSGLVGR